MRKFLLSILGIFAVVNASQAACCTYYVDMQDSWGDGWNGGSIDVYVNGILQGNYTVPSGSINTATFTACDGDNIQVYYNGGLYDGEVTYQIQAPGGQVGSYGPYPNIGITYSGTGDCSTSGGGGSAPTAGGTDCSTLSPICTDLGLNFTANSGGTPASTADPNNNYDCLFSQPNPSWYYIDVATSGAINMSLTAGSDIDFIIYGPFSSLTAAENGCGNYGYGGSGGNVVDCSYSSTNNETPSIPNAVAGQVYVMLITNYANVVQTINLSQTSGTGSTDCSAVTPCNLDYFEANISACNPATNTFDISGQVQFTSAPSTGQMIVEDCNGNSQTFNAPFTSPINYNITGITADGAACDITVYFTDDPSCTQNITYTNPVPCTPNCAFTFISYNLGACNPTDNTFEITGSVEFTDPPTTGQLIIQDCNGNSQTFNAPFSSPTAYTLSGIDSDGTLNCDITATFTADPACTANIGPFDYPTGCQCTTDAGTFTDGTTGNTTSTGPWNLCYGDQLNIAANGDWTPPTDQTVGWSPPPAPVYDPGIWLLVYDCPPTVAPPVDVLTDPCLLGVASTANGAWDIVNTAGDNSTYWFVPITMYSMTESVYAANSVGAGWCYDLGPAYEVTFLEDIVTSQTQDCQAGTATVTVNGGLPSSTPGEVFTGSNLSPGSASFNNTTAGNGGTITIGGLVDGDNWSFDITDNNGCPITVSGTFVGLEDPSFTYPQTAYCQDEPNPSPTITGVSGGTFSSTGGISINASTGVVNLAASTPGTYTITYTTPDPVCFDQTTFDITINPLPVVDGNDPTVCDGQQVTLNGTGADTYTWTGGVVDGVPFTPSVGTTTYTVTGTITATGCSSTGTSTVTVNPLDDASFTTTDYCEGSASPAATVTGTPGGTFAFNPVPGGGETINPSTGSITGGIGGTTYTIEYTTSGLCPATSTQTVTVNALPIVDVPDYSICTGGTIPMTATGASTYSWSPGTYLSATTGATVNSTPAANITYTVTGTDANGCVNTDITTVTVIPNAPINAGPDVSICLGESTTLTATGGVTYNWAAPISASGATQTVTPSTTTTYTVDGTDAQGCAGTDQVTVTVNPLPVVNAGTDQTVCEGTSVTLSGSGATSYTWDNGVTDGVAFTPGVGTVTYTVTGTDANGCVNTDQVNVTVNPLPVVDAGLDQTVCDGTAVTLSGSGASTYTWDNGVINNTAFTPSVGTVTYTVTGTDANGCVNTDQVNVTVNPLPVVDAGPDQTVCDGVMVTLAGSGAVSYTWNNGITDNTPFTPTIGTVTYTVTGTDANGCVNTDQVNVTANPLPTVNAGPDQTVCEGTSVTLSGSGAVSYTWDNGITDGVAFTPGVGTVTYTVTGTDANGCVNTDQVNVTVNPLPVVNAGPDQTVCEGTSVTLSGSGASTYTWDNGVVNNTAFTPAVGTVTYTVTGTDANGCVNTDQVIVTVNPLPVVNAGIDQTVCDGTAVTLAGSGAATYTWDNGVTDNTPFTPSVGTVTYTVTGTDANGCVNTDQVTVTVNPNPAPVINGATDYCMGSFSTLSTTVPYTTYQWSNGPTTPTVDVTAGTYTVTVTDANGCSGTSPSFTVVENSVITYNSSITICQGESAVIHGVTETVAGTYSQTFTLPTGCDSTSNVTLIVNPLPPVNAGVDQVVCTPTQTTLAASGATSYVWDNGVTDGVPFTQSVGTTTYTVTGTDANGCVNTDQVNITVNPLPVVDAGPDQTVCDGTSVTLAGSGATSYTWNNGVTDNTPFTPSVGTVTYTVTGTDANGCVNTDQVNVTVNPLPAVDAGPDQTVCDGVSVTLSGSGASTYTWDNGITDGVAFTPAVGTVTYTVTGTDANGCVNTDQVNVTVNPLPAVNAGPDQTVCDGTSVTLSGSGASTYTWDNGVINNTPFTPSVGTITYTVTGTDANGCVNTDQVDVTVNPLPVVDAGPDQTVCEGTAVTLAGSGATSYTWNNGVTDNVPFTPIVGTVTYTVTGTDANGCVNTDQVNVTVNPLPAVDAGPDQVVCDGVSVTLSGSGAVSYTWDNGVTDGVAFTPAVGTITYTVTGTDANGCVNTDQVDVTVNPLPAVNAGPDQAVCDGDQVTLSGSGASTYVWDNGITDGVAFTPSVGTITYTVTGTDANGCVNTDQVDVTVNPLPVIDAGPDQVVCDGVQVTLSGSGGSTYTWDNGVTNGVAFTPSVGTTTYTVTGTDANGCVNTDQMNVTVNPLPNVFAGNDFVTCEGNQAVLTASGAQSYVWDNGVVDGVGFTPTSTLTYTVVGTDANGCQGTDQVTVTVEPLPAVSFNADVTSGCAPLTVNFTNTTPGNMTDCIWTFSNGTTVSGCGTVQVTFPFGGLFDATLTTTSSNGCTNSVTYEDYIYVEDLPIASFTPSSSVVSVLNPQVQFDNTSINATNYIWNFGDGSPTSSVENPVHNFPDDGQGTYVVELVALSDLGCSDTAWMSIVVNEELIFYVPNTFTPDADDYNETFQAIFTSGYDPYDFTLLIFNRWGELIWESHDDSVGWDGTYGEGRSEIVQDGTYTWKIEFKTTMTDERVMVVGHVNVIR